MKKIVIAAFAALAFIGSAFAEVKLSFYNKVYEEDVIWTKGSEDKSGGILTAAGLPGKDAKTDFPALKERMFAEVKSDQVDAMVKGTLAIDDYDEKHFGFDGKVDDWYIEFRPVEILTLALHDNVSSEGSYLPIYDDNLQGGNIGSDGFTTVLRPNAFNKALRIAVTVPFEFDGYNDTDQNYINGSKDDGEDENFGPENEVEEEVLGVVYKYINLNASLFRCEDNKFYPTESTPNDFISIENFWKAIMIHDAY